ncbi:hypothetical protein GNI_191390 [Gregarina niphandrodes]|uniref:Uncharacterized protein n=1 Tax=Gregarina niphandrodes TaxID=110365 RepID=A0A023AWF7_GRENI|nr:hypothetical protein GNI_191390 [Gregarina niphandrodes]EZG43054.1 hypothetical protein GNI_191390 [Gregarina niphandrodes]|eukprot:XP_011133673.1 hypothetical protein GNI_191390 [Gregarina niphandrodes]
MQEQVDGVTVAVMRPVDPSELAELMARVPKEWQPVLQESAGWKTAHWNDGGGLEVTPAKPTRETKSRLCKTACVLGVGAAVGFFANYLLRSGGSAQPWVAKEDFEMPNTYAKLTNNQGAIIFEAGGPVPEAPCGSGTLHCDSGCSNAGGGGWPISFGSPWPVSFNLAWNITHQLTPKKCQVLCHTPQETQNSLHSRLLARFPVQAAGTPMSSQNQLRQLYAGRSFNCKGWSASARDIGTLRQCICDVASVTCEVTAKSKKAMHEVTFTDLEAPLARVANIFSDYPKEVYDVKNCGYECWSLAPDTKRTVRANRVAEAARRATQNSNSPSTSKHTKQQSAKDLTRDDVSWYMGTRFG